MRILRWSDLVPVPWKNGQGTTREIAREPAQGSFAWRLSIADVGEDGPFSNFTGMRRVLSVISGNGMELLHAHGTIHADYGIPVEFDGALDITSRLKNGPLQDLNLIFNPLLCTGSVNRIGSSESRQLRCENGTTLALYCMAGSVDLRQTEQLNKGDTLLVEGGHLNFVVGEYSSALLIIISRIF